MRSYLHEAQTAIRITIVIMLFTGIIYPLAVTGIAQGIFNHRANGSLVIQNGQVIGSSLIGQSFTAAKYFHGRPSDTVDANGSPLPYNAANSAGSNLGPTNPALLLAVEQNADAVRCSEGLPPGPAPIVTATPTPSSTPAASPAASSRPVPTATPCASATLPQQDIPVDAVTADFSGLDPDISVAYAELQVARVAKVRGLSQSQVQQLVKQHTFDRQFAVLGERRINVFELNTALDDLGH